MGGFITLGLKYRGKERIFEVWTNILPSIFANTQLLNKKSKAIQKLFNLTTKRKSTFPRPHVMSHISPSEYGLVLIDFDLEMFINAQHYCSPGKLVISNDYSGETLKLLKSLELEHRIYGFESFVSDVRINKQYLNRIGYKVLSAHQAIQTEAMSGNEKKMRDFYRHFLSGIVYYNTQPFSILEFPNSKYTWKEIKDVIERSWKTKTKEPK